MFRSAANPYDDIVAKATDENQTSEDWGVLATVWDKVNDDGPTCARNCITAIQKRLQHRNANVQLYSLTLADSLVMNCKVDLHREISSRAFTQTLSRLVQDRTTHDKVKKRVMQLLQKWSQQFKKDETLGIVEETYDQLKKSYRFDDPSSEPAAVPVSVLKQEEEDIQRAIAESEALARSQQQGRSSYAPPASTSYGQPASSAYGGYQQPQAGTSGTSFFTQADGKALPEIQAEPHQAAASAPPAPSASPAQGPSRVKALYDFEPQEEGELAFRKGDVIRVINSAYEGWWKGELDGRVGIFPLTYIEIIPDPTPESIAREAEMEAQVFAQAGNIDRLLSMLSAADAQGSTISDDDELMELYHQCILLRPKIVKLLDKYNQKQKDLTSLHDKFKIAKTAYDTMLEESYQRTSQIQTPYGQQPAYQAQPQQSAYGYQQQAPPQSQYPGQQPAGQQGGAYLAPQSGAPLPGAYPPAGSVSPAPGAPPSGIPYSQPAQAYGSPQPQPQQRTSSYGAPAGYPQASGLPPASDPRATSPAQPQQSQSTQYASMPHPGQAQPQGYPGQPHQQQQPQQHFAPPQANGYA
ncbi:hypothetical protein P389DRAFT_154014 [Cystobasidium minutum MCA 4210]|uniref:uncharacterized protein n=1 Tax=Cystobasidium minutum MCA 4210 TaxID=1397322 RepID=UPI0034D01CB2|eukprot:jgi/Rhomi1/154014/estExt_Genewise1.C_5_t20018